MRSGRQLMLMVVLALAGPPSHGPSLPRALPRPETGRVAARGLRPQHGDESDLVMPPRQTGDPGRTAEPSPRWRKSIVIVAPCRGILFPRALDRSSMQLGCAAVLCGLVEV